MRDEEGTIQLERTRSKLKEQPGDCAIGAVSPMFGGGYRLFIALDDDREISEVYDSLEDAIGSYIANKSVIEKLTKGAQPEG